MDYIKQELLTLGANPNHTGYTGNDKAKVAKLPVEEEELDIEINQIEDPPEGVVADLPEGVKKLD